MPNSLSTKIQKALLATMLVVTVLFLGVGIPIQLDMSKNSTDLVCFSLNVIATRDNNDLANELFERRYTAIKLRLQEILHVDKVLDVAIYDRDGKLLEAAWTGPHPPPTLQKTQKPHKDFICEESPRGLHFIKPIRAVGETFGWIRIVYDMSSIHKQAVIYYLFFGGLLALTLGTLFALLRWRMRQLVIAPLNTLISAMKNTKTDDLLSPVQIRNPTSELASLFKTYNDMSKRLHASHVESELQKAELAENELRFRTIVNQAPVGIMMFDNQGIVIDANEYLAGIMGSPSTKDIKGIDLLNDVDDENVTQCIQQAINEDKAYYENYYRSISGSKRVYIRVRLVRINAELLCGVFEDLTEHRLMLKALSESEENLAALNRDLETTVRKRTQALTNQANELRKANERLQELDELKTAFLSSVSHELRTPLTSILGFAKITLKQFRKHIAPKISDSPQAADKGRAIEENLSIVSREGERLSRLVNDVLDMARIESGRMPWHDKKINPTEIVHNVISASSGDYQGTDVVLKAEVEQDMVPIIIDPDKLFQVIRNLLHNAIKFTKAGSVTVVARHVRQDNEIEIRVDDTGSGINEADIDSVFDKFHQVENSPDGEAKPRGSGLGLAICQQIVEHYHGTIRVESKEGHGSSFIIRLPVS